MKINQHEKNLVVAVIVAGCLALFSASPANAQQAASTEQAAIENALRYKLDAEWSAAASAKNVEQAVSYYADDALVMPPNAPPATTKEAIRSAWNEMLTSPGAADQLEGDQGGSSEKRRSRLRERHLRRHDE